MNKIDATLSQFGLDPKALRKAEEKKAKRKLQSLTERKTTRRASVSDLRARKQLLRGSFEATYVKATVFLHICARCRSEQHVLAKLELVKKNVHHPELAECELINSHGAFDFYAHLPMRSTVIDRWMPACPDCVETEIAKRGEAE